jgi:hypothetical protein
MIGRANTEKAADPVTMPVHIPYDIVFGLNLLEVMTIPKTETQLECMQLQLS